MSGFDHSDAPQRPTVAVARDRYAAQALARNSEFIEVVRFRNLGHRPRRLASGKDYESARWQRG